VDDAHVWGYEHRAVLKYNGKHVYGSYFSRFFRTSVEGAVRRGQNLSFGIYWTYSSIHADRNQASFLPDLSLASAFPLCHILQLDGQSLSIPSCLPHMPSWLRTAWWTRLQSPTLLTAFHLADASDLRPRSIIVPEQMFPIYARLDYVSGNPAVAASAVARFGSEIAPRPRGGRFDLPNLLAAMVNGGISDRESRSLIREITGRS
jgi:hypothetical protein